MIVNGTNGNDIIDVFGAGTRLAVVGLPAQVNVTNSEGANDSLVVNALGGNDGVTATTLPAGVVKLTIDGGAGDDTLLGSQGADVFLGGDGDDFIFGDNGNDVAFLGAGDDVFQWDPGDGNDTIEGQDGTDTHAVLRLEREREHQRRRPTAGGSCSSATWPTSRWTSTTSRRIEFRALGGADNIVVGDLSGTDVTRIDLDLRGPNGGGDGAADTVTVNGTNGADVFGAAGDAGGVNVFGLQADGQHLLPGAGQRPADAQRAWAATTWSTPRRWRPTASSSTMNGGLGDDVFVGSEGDDLINGGDGNDTALMGAGDDTFVWNPGDDNDTLEGQAGFDTMVFNGANVAENINISANGGRVLFFRNIANVSMDLNDVEVDRLQRPGRGRHVIVGDLSGTDVTEINLNLAATGGAGDGAADTRDRQRHERRRRGPGCRATRPAWRVLGLAAQVNITGAEAANDRLTVNALAGDDVVEASGLAAGAIQLTRRRRRRRRRAGRRRRATTRCSAAPATTCWSAARASTSSTAAPATTS